MVKMHKSKFLRTIILALTPGLSFAGKPSTTSSPPSSGGSASQTPGGTTTSGTPGSMTQADIANIVDQALKKHEKDKSQNNIDPNIKMMLEAILGPTAAAAVITLVSVPLKSYYEEYSKRTKLSIWDRLPIRILPKQRSAILASHLEGFNNRQAQIKGQNADERYNQLIDNYHNLLKDSGSQIHDKPELLFGEGREKTKYLDVNLNIDKAPDLESLYRTAADKLLHLNKQFETEGSIASRTPEQLAYHNGEFRALSILHLTQGVFKDGNLGQAEKLARDIVDAREFHRGELKRKGLSAAERTYHTDRIDHYATLLTNVSTKLQVHNHHDAQIRFLETAESWLEKSNVTYSKERLYGISENSGETTDRMKLKGVLGTTLSQAKETYKTASPEKYSRSIQERLTKITRHVLNTQENASNGENESDANEVRSISLEQNKAPRLEDRVYQATKMAEDLVNKHMMTAKDSKTALDDFKKEFEGIKEALANHPHEQAAFHNYIIAAAQKAPDLFKNQSKAAAPDARSTRDPGTAPLENKPKGLQQEEEGSQTDTQEKHEKEWEMVPQPDTPQRTKTPVQEHGEFLNQMIVDRDKARDYAKFKDLEAEAASLHHFATPKTLDHLETKAKEIVQTAREMQGYHSRRSANTLDPAVTHHSQMSTKYHSFINNAASKLAEADHILPALELHSQSIETLQPGSFTTFKEFLGLQQEKKQVRDTAINNHKQAMKSLLQKSQENQGQSKLIIVQEAQHSALEPKEKGGSEPVIVVDRSEKSVATDREHGGEIRDHHSPSLLSRASKPTEIEKRIEAITQHHSLTDPRPTHGAKIELLK